MGGFNLGAFAGGAARGISEGLDNARKSREIERQDKMQKNADALQADLSAAAERWQQKFGAGNSSAAPAAPDQTAQVDQAVTPAAAGISAAAAPGMAPMAAAAGAVTAGVQDALATPQAAPKASPTLSDTIGFAQEMAEIKAKHGADTSQDMLGLAQLRKKISDEGIPHALGLFQGGNIDAGLQALNESGDRRGWKLSAPPQQTEITIAGVKVPTRIIQLQNDNGETRTINTAQDMYSMMAMDKQLEVGIKGNQEASDAEYKKRMAGVAEQNADTKLQLADAKTQAQEAKDKKGENKRQFVNDGVKQLDALFGVTRDPVSNMIDTSKIKDKKAYYDASSELERRVNAGESPMAVAQDLASRIMRNQKLGVGGIEGARPSPAASGTQQSNGGNEPILPGKIPTPWK